MLEFARSQAAELRDKRNAELNRTIATLADDEARSYERAFNETCRLHDRLVGYAQVAQANIGDVRLIVENPKVPRFALPSLGNGDLDVFMRHKESEITVGAAARQSGRRSATPRGRR